MIRDVILMFYLVSEFFNTGVGGQQKRRTFYFSAKRAWFPEFPLQRMQ